MHQYQFENVIQKPLQTVWDALKNPSEIISEWNARIEKISDTQWKELAEGDLYNTFTASFDEEEHLLHISSVNSKYAKEANDIRIRLERMDDHSTRVLVYYDIRTGAVFNKIALTLFGEKLAHHADHVIMKNIEKKVQD